MLYQTAVYTVESLLTMRASVLAWGSRGGIVLYKNEMYLFCNYWSEESINGYESVHYKIKDEYQQAFKDAIEQLNS
jgi:hypothetical protein